MNGINGIALSILTTGELALESQVLKKFCRGRGVREAGRGEWRGVRPLRAPPCPHIFAPDMAPRIANFPNSQARGSLLYRELWSMVVLLDLTFPHSCLAAEFPGGFFGQLFAQLFPLNPF